MAAESNNLEEILKPFYQRAFEAEDRLARLEAALSKNNDSGNEEQLKLVVELQSKLESVKAEQDADREKAMKEIHQLTAENAKATIPNNPSCSGAKGGRLQISSQVK